MEYGREHGLFCPSSSSFGDIPMNDFANNIHSQSRKHPAQGLVTPQ